AAAGAVVVVAGVRVLRRHDLHEEPAHALPQQGRAQQRRDDGGGADFVDVRVARGGREVRVEVEGVDVDEPAHVRHALEGPIDACAHGDGAGDDDDGEGHSG